MPDAALAAAYNAVCAAAAAGVDASSLAREASTLRSSPGGAVALPFAEPFGSIRLLVLPVLLDDGTHAALDAACAAVARLGVDDDVFRTPRAQLHYTLFHFGRPGDALAIVLDGAAQMAELARVRAVAAATPAFTLRIERVVLADSGVLLLLFQTLGDRFALREAMRAAFPSAPAKQTVLLHSSLARLLLPPAPDAWAAMCAACDAATAQLRGRDVRFASVWHVIERALPVDGAVTELPLLGCDDK